MIDGILVFQGEDVSNAGSELSVVMLEMVAGPCAYWLEVSP